MVRGLPKQRFPMRQEAEYQAFLLRRVRAAHRAVMAALDPLLKEHGAEIDTEAERAREPSLTRQDSAAPIFARMISVMNLVRLQFAVTHKPGIQALVKRAFAIGEQVTMFADLVVRQVYQLEVVQALNIDGTVNAWAKTNVGLITSIDSRYFDDVQRVVQETLERGLPTEKLREHLQERYAVSESRARLIARDQLSKLNGEIARERHKQIGVTQYLWTTSGDERVRDRHKELDGTLQRYDDPPIINDQGDRGHPGDDYQCRCVGTPVLEGDDVSAMLAEAEARKQREEKGLFTSPVVTGEIKPIPRRQPTSKWFKAMQRQVRAARAAI